VAVASFWVIQFLIAIVNSIGIGLPETVVNLWCQVVNSIAGGYCFVFAGAKTAPRYRFIVAIVLAVCLGVAAGVIVTLAIVTGKYHDSIVWLIISSILALGAGVLACFYFHEKSNCHETDA
jgi:hypothetical protein